MLVFYDAAANMHSNFRWILGKERKMDSIDNVNNVNVRENIPNERWHIPIFCLNSVWWLILSDLLQRSRFVLWKDIRIEIIFL